MRSPPASCGNANGTNRKRCGRRTDGGMELTMRVGVAPDLENWILSWGDHAEVMEPLELRRRIATTVRNMAAKYQMTASVIVIGTSNGNS